MVGFLLLVLLLGAAGFGLYVLWGGKIDRDKIASTVKAGTDRIVEKGAEVLEQGANAAEALKKRKAAEAKAKEEARKLAAESKPQKPPTGWIYDISVAGTSNYQKAIEKINGRRTSESAKKEVVASLDFENDNQFDDQAVRVDIDGKTVGYLSREEARKWRRTIKKDGLKPPIGVPALIVGGWDRGRTDRGHFGVRLALYNG